MKIIKKTLKFLILYFIPQGFMKIRNPILYRGFFYDFFNIFFNKSLNTDVIKLETSNYNRIAYVHKALSLFNLNECKYLEIGTDRDITFNTVPLPISKKFGVDPVRGGNIRSNSNDFFLKNKEYFDVVFIDGDHSYKQAQLDVINALKFSKNKTYIIIHDMLPVNKFQATMPRQYKIWTGDVWKIGFELSHSKNLRFCIANIDHGVGIAEVNPSTEYLIKPELNNKNFDDYIYKYHSLLPIKSAADALDFIK